MFKGKYVMLFIIFIIIGLYYFKNYYPAKNISYDAKVIISSNEINVELAKTPKEKSQGLSGKSKIAGNEGMLFYFPQKTYPIFWMKEMKFALDIIWISDGKIIDIDKNVPPPLAGQNDGELKRYKPDNPANYVLEVNGGFCDKNGIKAGDKVTINFLSVD